MKIIIFLYRGRSQSHLWHGRRATLPVIQSCRGKFLLCSGLNNFQLQHYLLFSHAGVSSRCTFLLYFGQNNFQLQFSWLFLYIVDLAHTVPATSEPWKGLILKLEKKLNLYSFLTGAFPIGRRLSRSQRTLICTKPLRYCCYHTSRLHIKP